MQIRGGICWYDDGLFFFFSSFFKAIPISLSTEKIHVWLIIPHSPHRSEWTELSLAFYSPYCWEILLLLTPAVSKVRSMKC